MEWRTIFFDYVPILTPILIPIFIFIAGHFFSVIVNYNDKKKNRTLIFLDRQINEFYGPLYILTKAGKSLIDEFMNKVDKNGVFPDPSDENHVAEWRLWIEDVLFPLNNKIEKIILEKGNLIVDYKIDKSNKSECLIDFLIHNAQWKIIIRKWSLNDFTEYKAERIYPKELISYAETYYHSLKEKQNIFRKKIFLPIIMSELNNDKPINTPVKYIIYESNIIDLFNRAKELKQKKDYHNAMRILYVNLKDKLPEKYKIQLWDDFHDTEYEYLRNEHNLFENDVRKQDLVGIINYEVNYKREKQGDYLMRRDKNQVCIMYRSLEDWTLTNKKFELYDEVMILSFIPLKDKEGNWGYPFCEVRTQDNQVGWINSKYLWFIPRDASNSDAWNETEARG